MFTSAFVFICCFCVKSLEQDSHILVELVPVAVHDVKHCVVLHLPLLQLLDTLPQLALGPLPQLQALRFNEDRSTVIVVRIGGMWD